MNHIFPEQVDAFETRTNSQAQILSCMSILTSILAESIKPKTSDAEKLEKKIDPQNFELPDSTDSIGPEMPKVDENLSAFQESRLIDGLR